MAETSRVPTPARISRSGIRLGRILGVEVSLDYSWFILLFLILATFSGVVFPDFVPGLDQGAYLAMGIAGTFLFFASLLAHELSHSVVARARGVEVEGITLFVFGGMARTRSEARSAGDEFLIAGVGPLMSAFLSVGFYGLAWAAERLTWGDPVWAVAYYLGLLNAALALFNLLPGFPLDGGRLLRAILWRTRRNYREATRVATTFGRWLGYLIIGGGVFLLFTTPNLVASLWYIFIGWFLANAANASYQQVLLRSLLEGVRARDAMTPSPETVTPDLDLDHLVHERFLKRPFNSFPVTEDGIVIGMVTLSQVKKVDRDDWGKLKVADIMTPLADTLIVPPDASMTDVLERMAENETRRVIVAEDWELRGIITGGDIANWFDRAGLVQ